jgi:hypothetical protein
MREVRSGESSARPARATIRTARPCWMTEAGCSASRTRTLADSASIALSKLAELQPTTPADAPEPRCSCSSWSGRVHTTRSGECGCIQPRNRCLPTASPASHPRVPVMARIVNIVLYGSRSRFDDLLHLSRGEESRLAFDCVLCELQGFEAILCNLRHPSLTSLLPFS